MADNTVYIIGLAATLLASAIPQFLYWKNSKKADETKRKWALDDVLRDKKILIIENRIEKIEKLAEALSKSFHSKRLSFIEYLTNPLEDEEIPLSLYETMKYTIELQKEFYAITPMIVSLAYDTEGIIKSWEKLADFDNQLITFIRHITVETSPNETLRKNVLKELDEMRSDFNQIMAKFYDDLDSICLKEIEDSILFEPR